MWLWFSYIHALTLVFWNSTVQGGNSLACLSGQFDLVVSREALIIFDRSTYYFAELFINCYRSIDINDHKSELAW
jgi:hypothetical protein